LNLARFFADCPRTRQSRFNSDAFGGKPAVADLLMLMPISGEPDIRGRGETYDDVAAAAREVLTT
jgi:hypothetical protein